jgi:hypothetical protein
MWDLGRWRWVGASESFEYGGREARECEVERLGAAVWEL